MYSYQLMFSYKDPDGFRQPWRVGGPVMKISDFNSLGEFPLSLVDSQYWQQYPATLPPYASAAQPSRRRQGSDLFTAHIRNLEPGTMFLVRVDGKNTAGYGRPGMTAQKATTFPDLVVNPGGKQSEAKMGAEADTYMYTTPMDTCSHARTHPHACMHACRHMGTCARMQAHVAIGWGSMLQLGWRQAMGLGQHVSMGFGACNGFGAGTTRTGTTCGSSHSSRAKT